jgi:hypothetical protein
MLGFKRFRAVGPQLCFWFVATEKNSLKAVFGMVWCLLVVTHHGCSGSKVFRAMRHVFNMGLFG